MDAFRPEVQGSQDWDLALRASERARCIRHLPHVLYHWRTVPGSTARADTAKHYSLEAGRHAVEDHLVRCGEQAEVELLPFGHLHVRHATAQPKAAHQPHHQLALRQRSAGSLQSLLRNTGYPDIELLVATSHAGDEEILPSGTHVVSAEHATVAELLNRAVAMASGDMLCFVNSRCEAQDAGWLPALAAEAARPEIGAVGARLLLADGTVWHAGYLLDPCAVVLHPYRGAPAGFPGLRNRAILQQEMSCVSADCFAIKRTVFVEVGGFDTASGPFTTWISACALSDAGFRNVWTPGSHSCFTNGPNAKQTLAHFGSCSARWGERLAHDLPATPTWRSRTPANPTYDSAMTPRFSIALATRNGARYLEALLDSLVAQLWAPYELVVSDDASEDRTMTILEAFSARAPFPVRLLRNPQPLGVEGNFSCAIAACAGDCIALADQDDLWRPEKLARLAQALMEPGTLAVFSDAEVVERHTGTARLHHVAAGAISR